jgi:hypothetical protein
MELCDFTAAALTAVTVHGAWYDVKTQTLAVKSVFPHRQFANHH